jgi:hypothetical protein
LLELNFFPLVQQPLKNAWIGKKGTWEWGARDTINELIGEYIDDGVNSQSKTVLSVELCRGYPGYWSHA